MTAHQRIRGEQFAQQIAAFGEQIFFKKQKTSGPQQKLAVNWLDGCWLGFNTRTEEHIVSNKAALTKCRSIRRRNKEDRTYSETRGVCRTDVWRSITTLRNQPEPSRCLTDNDETQERRERQTPLHHEEDGSEFGATLGCKGCLEIGQPHTGVPSAENQSDG